MPFWRQHEPIPEAGAGWLVVGLGNPGSRYENTRHNIGFMAVEAFARRHDLRFKGSKHRADVATGAIKGIPILLAKPVTFMNESGNAVVRLTRYFNVPGERVLVVCDDLDLPFGTMRLRSGGGSGGNGGLKSIIQSLGTEQFGRLRLGVGRPPDDAARHVLQRFPRDEAGLLSELLDLAAEAIEAVAQHGVAEAMNQFNRDWLPELSPA